MGCAASHPDASVSPGDAPADKSGGPARGSGGGTRRLSMAGGPAGSKGVSAAEDARRRRLSIAVTPASAAKAVAQENQDELRALAVGEGDHNVPVYASGNAAALPVVWAEWSRPGNDPMKRVKENQDSCLVQDGFDHKANQMLFIMADGHGPNGGLASQFVKARLPQTLAASEVEKDPFVALNHSCIATNQELHMSPIDVYVSGTTGVVSLLRDNHLFVANVGDSRAVLARMSATAGLKALDLSNDHKPDRADEMARIQACGGRVFEWGVPRVWLKDVDMPGLAMSRSFGDIAAETVGVYAEPELSEVILGKNDRFIIWATDGVWEFISSQEAVDIVWSTLSAGGSPLEACAALVKESTKRWNEEEDVVDDTTVILAILNYS